MLEENCLSNIDIDPKEIDIVKAKKEPFVFIGYNQTPRPLALKITGLSLTVFLERYDSSMVIFFFLILKQMKCPN